MNQQDILLDIEVRAKRLRLPIYTLCKEAKVHPTTFSKWKGGVDARLSGLERLTAVLSRMEGLNG